MQKYVPFGEWRPDEPDFLNPGALQAKNVIPGPTSYRPVKGLVAQSTALTAYARGAVAAKDTGGNTYFYAGDETKLYQIRNQTVSEKSKSAGAYSTASTDVWEFAQFGQTILATNYTDAVQGIAVGAAGNFSDHFTSTNKPKARHIGVVRNFVVLGNTNDTTDGVKPNRVWWSGIGDSLDLDPDATTQSDFQDVPDGGAVQKIVGGSSYGLVFLERQIQRMTYAGSPLVFDFSPVSERLGTNVSGSVISRGRRVFFWSEEGVHAFDGASIYDIGHNKVDRWLLGQFDPNNSHRVSAAIDPANSLVSWAFPGEGSTNSPNMILFYNWKENRFSYAEIDTQLVVHAETQGFTLDELDNLSTDIDDGTLDSFDSDEYKGGEYRFSAFNSEGKLSYFTGSNLEATLDTDEQYLSPGRRTLVRFVRPMLDGSSVAPTVAVIGRNAQTTTETADTAASEDTSGDISQRNNSRFQRFRMTVPAASTWEHAQGLEVDYVPTGRR